MSLERSGGGASGERSGGGAGGWRSGGRGDGREGRPAEAGPRAHLRFETSSTRLPSGSLTSALRLSLPVS